MVKKIITQELLAKLEQQVLYNETITKDGMTFSEDIKLIEEKYPRFSKPSESYPLGKEFDLPERKKVVNFWHEHFPSLHKIIGRARKDNYGIFRRMGPLVIGIKIGFNENSSNKHAGVYYQVLNLSIDRWYNSSLYGGIMGTIYDFISIKNTGYSSITIGTWERDSKKAMEIMEVRKNNHLPLVSPALTLDEIFEICKRYFKQFFKYCNEFDFWGMVVPMTLAAWCGEVEKAEEYYQWAKALLRSQLIYEQADQ